MSHQGNPAPTLEVLNAQPRAETLSCGSKTHLDPTLINCKILKGQAALFNKSNWEGQVSFNGGRSLPFAPHLQLFRPFAHVPGVTCSPGDCSSGMCRTPRAPHPVTSQ